MKLTKMITTTALTFAVSTSVFAACSADIDMGGKKITNAVMTANATQSEVATKVYVDSKSGGYWKKLSILTSGQTYQPVSALQMYKVSSRFASTEWRFENFAGRRCGENNTNGDSGLNDMTRSATGEPASVFTVGCDTDTGLIKQGTSNGTAHVYIWTEGWKKGHCPLTLFPRSLAWDFLWPLEHRSECTK